MGQRKWLRNVMAWLIMGQVNSEETQREALALQQLKDCWRSVAMQALEDSKAIPTFKVGEQVEMKEETNGSWSDKFKLTGKVVSTERIEDGWITIQSKEGKDKEIPSSVVRRNQEEGGMQIRFFPEKPENPEQLK